MKMAASHAFRQRVPPAASGRAGLSRARNLVAPIGVAKPHSSRAAGWRTLSVHLFAGLWIVIASAAHAAEFGKGMYLLGSKNSMAGVVPPAGTYVTSETYIYSGEA